MLSALYAIAYLSVPSVTRVDQSKMIEVKPGTHVP